MPTHGPPSPILQKSVKRQRQDSYDGTSSRNGFSSPEQPAGDANLGGATSGGSSSSGRSEAGASASYPGIPVTSDSVPGPGHGHGQGHDSSAGDGAADTAIVDDAAANTNTNTGTAPAAGSDSIVPTGKPGQSSNFRNVSACNRCRLRKNRCDQKLPSCASCNKVGVPCVGYDPITKKEIPRSYVFYLETRVEVLEKLLASNNIPFPPAEDLDLCSRPGADGSFPTLRDSGYSAQTDSVDARNSRPHSHHSQALDNALLPAKKQGDQSPAMLNIVSPTKPRSLASTSGVSFARVVFAAVQYSVSDQNGGPEKPVSSNPSNPAGAGTSMRDSFFGLHTRPTIQPATFPARDVAIRLVTLYFEHANPQIPILHRGEFMRMFERAYASEGRGLTARELYMLNMVFAIGCGVIVGEPVKAEAPGGARIQFQQTRNQSRPEEYHASAIVHLEECLSSSGGGLEVLQAVLLLANFALLRPVPPGLWYIVGVAVRLAVDLGLHHEDGTDIEGNGQDAPDHSVSRDSNGGSSDRGRRLWIRDMRRRLWWCTYSFDRLVSTCVGRPFGISDQVITTEFPSVLDDAFITPNGFIDPPSGEDHPSYKRVAHHYFRLRMLQSEILQVLQYNQAQIARTTGAQARSLDLERNRLLPSPYLVQFDSYRSWRMDIDRRLREWKDSAPSKQDTGVAFSTEFLFLNYWQAIVLLYKQSLSIPAMFEGEYNPSNEVNSPTAFTAELREDEERIYLKVAEAGQKILRIYRQLHLSSLVSYTYLSTHHLFMAGISYLYAIWHSPAVRSRLTMDEVDFTVLAAKSVFTDMIDKCPPAETCRDAFDRTAKATIQMATSKGGFGSPIPQTRRPPTRRETSTWAPTPADMAPKKPTSRHRHHHQSEQQQQQQFQFDIPMGDSLSSPSLSTAGDIATPPLAMAHSHSHSHGRPSPSRRTGSYDDGGSVMEQSMIASPSVPRSQATPGSTSGGNPYMAQQNQQFGIQGHMEYPDAQTMELLQTFGTGSNGGFGGMDQAQMDFGFGINWEGVHNDYAEAAQPMNPFDTFFFGGPQGGNAGFGSSNGEGGHSGGNDM
ncbi:transcriptional regulator family: Fungal Specific TF [Trichoderma aggressivum f. europaeum]|uniref:Transcriptional regulator family: Fungal Specific TF n=1 Tax=Trichoderma aggressivum f. europaeum TaxID=173218 RepID=A0AAE1M316_9HYPO|nr:transcriptional regulator family: Fungal Specific TF [Trichoderma aggressivum f. europaeum]